MKINALLVALKSYVFSYPRLALNSVHVTNYTLNSFYEMIQRLTEGVTTSKRRRLKRYKLTSKSFILKYYIVASKLTILKIH